MKKLFLLLLMASSHSISAQKNLISMDGIGVFKIGMSQAEVEKLAGKKIVLANAIDTNAVSYQDTAIVRYNNAAFHLMFQRQYTGDNEFFMQVIRVKTGSPVYKTSTGSGVGHDKMKIIAAYPHQPISMGPEYEESEEIIKSKTRYYIHIKNDDLSRAIMFYLTNNKTVAVEVMMLFSDEER